MSPTRETPWRVFVSHTTELREYPKDQSYVAAVEQAISAAGHVIVDMAGFPAADQPPAELCVERVQGCDIYVGVLGTRYGSPVPDRPEVSYTELEFDTATAAGTPRLVFILDTDAEDVGIPPRQLVDLVYGARQDAFLSKVAGSGLSRQRFASPAQLEQLVERSLTELEKTRLRIGSGMVREQVPAGPPPARASKFVNPPPAVAPSWFQDRQIETGLLAKYVSDPAIRLVIVSGRGGIGKTAMVCRLLKGYEAGRIPDVKGDLAETNVGGIVYLSHAGGHQIDYPTLVADLIKLLPGNVAGRLDGLYQDPRHTPAEMMNALLECFPVGDPVVVLLDNLESVMDTERDMLTEQALQEALTSVLTAPAHAITVIATTRVTPPKLLTVEPARQRRMRLDRGLGSPDAETALRELDDDGRLGLRDADDELLDSIRQHTRGFPRALEAVKAILDGDETLTPQDLVARTRHLPDDRVVEVLIGEAYNVLGIEAQQVMQALAVFPTPVSTVGVDFLLQPVNPTTNAGPILTRLVHRQMVRFHDQHYYLHPVDREYALHQIPAGTSSDTSATFTLTGLRARAADYYTKIRTPRDSWRSLDDVQPQLAEFDLRCAIGHYNSAAAVLADIEFDYLRMWGHYRTLVTLHHRLHERISDPTLNADHLSALGSCHYMLGEYRRAIELYAQALTMSREIGDRFGEGTALGNLGDSHSSLGDYPRAIELHTQALEIAREIGDRRGECTALGSLGSCHYMLGEDRRAIELHTQALEIAREIGDRFGESTALGSIGDCYYMLGDYPRAIELRTQALEISREIGDRLGESTALGSIGSCHRMLGDYPRAIDLHTQALEIAREIGDRRGEGTALGSLGSCHYMQGEHPRAIELHTQALEIAREIGDRFGESTALGNLGSCHCMLGDYPRAIDLHTQALEISRDIGDRLGESTALGNLGSCHCMLGDYPRAIDLHTQALTISRDIGSRYGESIALGNLGSCHRMLGDYPRAIDLHTQALTISRDIGSRYLEATALDYLGRAWVAAGDIDRAGTLLEHAVSMGDATGDIEASLEARSALAGLHLQSGEPLAALATAATALERSCPSEDATLMLLDGVALSHLGRVDEAVQAFHEALASADRLLALADRNVAALQARALALSGLAAATGDRTRVEQAAEALSRVHAMTTAAGVIADSRRLLDAIAADDRAGVLADIRAALEE